MKTLIFLGLGGFSIFYLLVWRFAIREGLKAAAPTPLQLGIGAITNFFDTLGIGSFATTTALFRMNKLVTDRLIPGTLNVGHTPATIAQAFIYIAIVEVDVTTLVAMIAAACLGAGVVSGWNAQKVRIGMGIALLVAASLFLMTQLGLMPKGGDTLGLTGAKLALAVAGNFVLGALMSLGIGLYGPCMILIYLLGMVPTAAFPIMMGSCAFLMPTSTARFLKAKSLDPQAALGLALGGVPAVLIAAFIVKSMPLEYVRWLVIVVVVYTAITMLRTAFLEKDQPAA
jgi:uncharacterized membrane protein YfcA